MNQFSSLELKIDGDSEHLRIYVQGELVSGNCADLKQVILESLSREPRTFVLDLRNVHYLDTGGAGLLVGLHKLTHARAIRFTLANLHPRVAEVLRMTRLFDLFRTTNDN